MIYSRETAVALQAVRAASVACTYIRKVLQHDDTLIKSDLSPVTVADYSSQVIINSVLARECTFDAVVSEESSENFVGESNAGLLEKILEFTQPFIENVTIEKILKLLDHGKVAGELPKRYWTIDPIDGTKGYLRGGQYAIALALIEQGEPKLGVLGCPNLAYSQANNTGLIMFAIKGEGTYATPMNDPHTHQKCCVDQVNELSDLVICESYEKAHTSHDKSATIANQLGIKTKALQIDSQCKYAEVARGNASLYLRIPKNTEYTEKIWDHAAGMLLVEEAGGIVTDLSGQKLDFNNTTTLCRNTGIVASSGHIHNKIISQLKGV